jgi:hypothetical protein
MGQFRIRRHCSDVIAARVSALNLEASEAARTEPTIVCFCGGTRTVAAVNRAPLSSLLVLLSMLSALHGLDALTASHTHDASLVLGLDHVISLAAAAHTNTKLSPPQPLFLHCLPIRFTSSAFIFRLVLGGASRVCLRLLMHLVHTRRT